MNNFIPFENLIYDSYLTERELLHRLSQFIVPKKYFRFNDFENNNKRYEGYVSANIFEINRILNYRNSFMPFIKGEIKDNNGRARINVKMRIHPMVMVFMSLWLGIIGIIIFALLISSIKENKFEPSILIVISMFLAGYFMTLFGFKYESKKSKKDLEEILDARLIE